MHALPALVLSLPPFPTRKLYGLSLVGACFFPILATPGVLLDPSGVVAQQMDISVLWRGCEMVANPVGLEQNIATDEWHQKFIWRKAQ